MMWGFKPKGKSLYFAELVFCINEQFHNPNKIISFEDYVEETEWLEQLAEKLEGGRS